MPLCNSLLYKFHNFHLGSFHVADILLFLIILLVTIVRVQTRAVFDMGIFTPPTDNLLSRYLCICWMFPAPILFLIWLKFAFQTFDFYSGKYDMVCQGVNSPLFKWPTAKAPKTKLISQLKLIGSFLAA